MRAGFIFILCTQSLLAGGWALGAGGGTSTYFTSDPSYTAGLSNLNQTQTGWRVEAEAGYYAGRKGFNVLMVYGEAFSRSDTRLTLFRDQHLALLGEYRLFVVKVDPRLQFAPGLGPSIHRVIYYSNEDKGYLPIDFTLDAEFAAIFFSTNHFVLRGQAGYSFPLLRPLSGGTLNVTLRAAYRS